MTESPAQLPYDNWHKLLADPRFSPSSEAIQQYLQLTDGLESPVSYNVWSFLSLVAALCGNRIQLTHGPMGSTPLNLGIILTGSPAIRKSTSLSVMQKFAEGLPISYGPSDTSGQRQGIMSAMMPRWQRDSQGDVPTDISIESLDELSNFDSDSILAKLPDPVKRSASELYFVAKELGRLIASTTRELLDFFNDAMEGEPIHYQLKNQEIRINKPLINLIGATTPMSLGQMMPRGAEGHGFLSRILFVHASSISKAVPIPERWTERHHNIRDSLHERIAAMLERSHEEIGLTKAAMQTFSDLYGYQPPLADLRLQAYIGRRSGHLLKTAAILALLRADSAVAVQASDIRLAHGLLVLTETTMDRAFYGLDTGLYSKLLCAVNEMAEGDERGVVSLSDVQAYAGYLGPKNQLQELLMSLQEQGKLEQVGTPNSPAWRMSTKTQEMGEAKLRMAFLGSPQPDEFKSHQSKLRTIEGGAG